MEQDVDIHLGRRLRSRRRLLGLTQLQLALAVGVRFQQIQKYECGANRMSASRLWLLAQFLEAPIGYFYGGLESTRRTLSTGQADGAEIAANEESEDLIRAYYQLNERPRRRLLDLAKSMKDNTEAA